jgi:hypothetical protein
MSFNRIVCLAPVAAFILSIFSPVAEAMPHFSRKYAVPCATCHSAWPKLNDEGVKFKLNGYQLPGGQDGEEAAKLPLTDSLFLDVGPANPPVSLIMYGGAILIQPNNGYNGKQEGKFFCCVEGNDVNLEAAGSASGNVAYRVSLPWGKQNISQGYVRFVNLFGPGFMAVDVGLMNVVDNDAIPDKDSWFATPLPAYWGSPYHPLSAPAGLFAHISDTGGRIYGRPGFGMFTYEVGVFTGAGIAGKQQDDNAQAYTIMGRADVEKVSVSMRSWTNKSAWLDHTKALASGQTILFKADPALLDEKTDELILGARYADPMYVVDLAVDRGTYSLTKTRTAAGADGASHTLDISPQNRTGMTANITVLLNQWMEAGLALSVINSEKYTVTLDGSAAEAPAVNTTLSQLRFTFSPAVNARLALEAQLDLTGKAGRIGADGKEYKSQHKLLAQWQLTF